MIRVIWLAGFLLPVLADSCEGQSLNANTSASDMVSAMDRYLLRSRNFDMHLQQEWKQTQEGQLAAQGKTRYRFRRLLPDFVHQATWYQLDDEFAKMPGFESLYNGNYHIQLQIQTAAGKGMIILFPKPKMKRIYGQRVSGMGILTGISPYHTGTEFDLFEICQEAGWVRARQRDSADSFCIESKTRVGLVSVQVARNACPKEIIIEADRTNLRLGRPLQLQQIRRLHVRYFDFRFESATDGMPEEISGFQCVVDQQQLNGISSTTENRVTIEHLAVDDSVDKLEFITQIPNGTRVRVVDNGNIFFRWNNGNIEKDFSRQMETNLLGFRFVDRSRCWARLPLIVGGVFALGLTWCLRKKQLSDAGVC